MKDGWQNRALKDVSQVVNGGTPKSGVAEYWGGDVQWLTPKEMGKTTGREIATTERTITNTGLSKSSARLIPAGSVILSTRAPIGHLAINLTPMSSQSFGFVLQYWNLFTTFCCRNETSKTQGFNLRKSCARHHGFSCVCYLFPL